MATQKPLSSNTVLLGVSLVVIVGGVIVNAMKEQEPREYKERELREWSEQHQREQYDKALSEAAAKGDPNYRSK